jgi:hypothetical protein
MIEHSRVNFGQVDSAEQRSLKDRNNYLASTLVEKYG